MEPQGTGEHLLRSILRGLKRKLVRKATEEAKILTESSWTDSGTVRYSRTLSEKYLEKIKRQTKGKGGLHPGKKNGRDNL